MGQCQDIACLGNSLMKKIGKTENAHNLNFKSHLVYEDGILPSLKKTSISQATLRGKSLLPQTHIFNLSRVSGPQPERYLQS